MNIILVGAGKVGFTIAQHLSHEGHSVTVIDRSAERIGIVNAYLDVMTVCGSVDIDLLRLSGAENADLLIAATNSDESNILCCMVGKKLGVKHTIARVRDDEHYREVILLRDELGLSLTISPEHSAANEISRVLRFPSAAKVESIAKGQAELVELRLTDSNPLCGTALHNYHSRFGDGTLICAVRRSGKVHIPGGDFILQAGDSVSVVGAPLHIHALFKSLSILKKSARYVMIVGGGRIAAHLAKQMLGMGLHVKLLEKDPEKSEMLKDLLPKAEIVCCDGSRPDVLEEEGMKAFDAFVALTGSDEINLIIASYAQRAGVEKVVSKVNETHYIDLSASFGLDAPVQPRYLTAQQVLQYVRSMENSANVSGIESLRRILDGNVEVLEFRAREGSPCVGRSLQELSIRANILLAAIIRDGKCRIPRGSDHIEPGDGVIAVTTSAGMSCLEDILR